MSVICAWDDVVDVLHIFAAFVCCQLLSEMIGFSAAQSLVSFAFTVSDSCNFK